MKQLTGAVVAGALLVCGLASPAATAGISVTSYETVALTNAYAPLSEAQYFARQRLANVSPAVADVSADWTGTNAGGSTPTWHWVGSSHASSATTITSSGLTITGAGSFSYRLTTTSGFVDPTSGSIYGPGGAGDYQAFFVLDAPAAYSATSELGQWSVLRLASTETGALFDLKNLNSTPITVSPSGVLAPGHYQIRASAGLGAANLGNGVNDYARSGSFSNFSFSVQVPEPSGLAGVMALAMSQLRPRSCRGRWGMAARGRPPVLSPASWSP